MRKKKEFQKKIIPNKVPILEITLLFLKKKKEKKIQNYR